MKSDVTEKFATTVSVDGCGVLSETHNVWNGLNVDITRVSSVGNFLPISELPERESRDLHQSAIRGSTPHCSLKLSPEVFSTREYLRKTVEV